MIQMEQEVEAEKTERAECYSKIEMIQLKLQNAYVVQNTARMNAEQAKAKKTDAKAVSQQIHEEGTELETQILEIQENQDSIQVELEVSEKLEQELTEQIASAQKELDLERELEGRRVSEAEKVHLAYASLEQKYQFLLENEQRIQDEIEKFNEELSTLLVSKGDASEEMQKRENQIEELRLTIENSKDLFEEIQKQILSYSGEKEELTKKHKAFLAEREALSKHLADLDKESFRLNSQKETAEQVLEKQIDYMWEEYEVTYNMALENKEVFKQLFGGGKGTLELQEEEDLLEAGIRIIAQPPGKKLQNMMQLSGGEKALTAISLLFAIQNLKPSPFCLLDEIEAALDDSNVDRYARYLHKLTKNTQFIVITHRRGTMTAADRLYGITMQEKGVSTLVSVDLLEKDLTN